ncbi:hypothetical protein [Paenibacillus sp. NEAU-GSW1]|uniref:hypothetical protein n=1 Tax=Paenibacillus sp. NEAU-GSW1 TaxID=2682486 RepID=UPI0012E180AE|nr:hypothetical protein [Paenibacillus sp. NEAU-GSW1]MUT66522.1 hypothetical protein [Paenibacillus sp. NEAU-GSW1]
MSEQTVNEQDLIRYIAEETEIDVQSIERVLKHEQKYMDSAKTNAKGEVEIDSDELVDYIISRPDVKLDELKVESILDAEMDYYMDKGLAGYID